MDEGKRSEDGARSRNQSGEEVTPCLEEDSYHINSQCHFIVHYDDKLLC